MGHKSLFIFMMLLSQAPIARGMEMKAIRSIADDEEVDNNTPDEVRGLHTTIQMGYGGPKNTDDDMTNAKIEAKYPGWNEAIQLCPTASAAQLYPWWKTLCHLSKNTNQRFNYNVNMNITPEIWVCLMQLKLKQLKAPCVQFKDQNRSASALTYLVNQMLEKEWEVMTKHNSHIQWDMGDEQWAALAKQQERLLSTTIAHLLNQCCSHDTQAIPAPHHLLYIARQNWETPETKNTFIKSCLHEFQLQCQLTTLLEQK